MSERWIAGLLAAAAATMIAVAGCNATTPGIAQTVGQNSGSTSATGKSPSVASSTDQASTRPREVRLNGVDACALLSQAALQSFGVDKPASPDKDTTFQTSTCVFFSNSANTALRVTPVTTIGIQRFMSGSVIGEQHDRTVQGFPAVEIYTSGSSTGNDICTVVVDVADGQVLHTMFSEVSKKPPLGKEAVCQKANELADAAMTTLLAR